jgi:two-component system response regulator AtoC
MIDLDRSPGEPRLAEAARQDSPVSNGRARLATAPPPATPHLCHDTSRAPGGNLRGLGRFGPMIGASPAMHTVFDLIARVAPTDACVLVLGESGTGKELVAETVHGLSRRRARPMISINCGAISSSLIESEIFGHERGSFTGADRAHHEHFERADGGTLFLDEINEMPFELQVRLLRVLESGVFHRVGGDTPIKVNVRIVAAAKPNLERAAAEGRFREDLLYRLKVFPIYLPPLRERDGDLALLTAHFLAELNRPEEPAKHLVPLAFELLSLHDWPGNVRELKHVLERAFILSDAEIGPGTLAGLSGRPGGPERTGRPPGSSVTLEPGMPLAEAERHFVLATLAIAGGNKARAAQMLRIHPKTLYCRLREYHAAGHWEAARQPSASHGRRAH